MFLTAVKVTYIVRDTMGWHDLEVHVRYFSHELTPHNKYRDVVSGVSGEREGRRGHLRHEGFTERQRHQKKSGEAAVILELLVGTAEYSRYGTWNIPVVFGEPRYLSDQYRVMRMIPVLLL